MRWKLLGGLMLGVMGCLGGCGTPAQVTATSAPGGSPAAAPLPPPPSEVIDRAKPAGPYTVLDRRSYFHQHYDVPGEVTSDTVYVGNLRREIKFTTSEQWQGISGYVWGNLGLFGPKSMFYIPSPYTGWLWRWDTFRKRWVRYESGFDGQALRYVRVTD